MCMHVNAYRGEHACPAAQPPPPSSREGVGFTVLPSERTLTTDGTASLFHTGFGLQTPAEGGEHKGRRAALLLALNAAGVSCLSEFISRT